MFEVWKDVEGYEGRYQVSNFGNIRSVKKKPFLILKGDYQKNGYKRVYLWLDGGKKNFLVHRLVAKAFVSNPFCYDEVNHLDEDKSNNRVDNLQWCTHHFNMNYGNVKNKISQANSGRIPSRETKEKLRLDTSNRRWINNGKIERYVALQSLANFMESGWTRGRLSRRADNV